MRSFVGIRAVSILVGLALCCGATAAVAAVDTSQVSVAGTWSGKYSGTYFGSFTLTWKLTGSKLGGTITLSKPKGKYGITGKVGRGGAISFGVVAVGATYTGTVSGLKMSGKYDTPAGGGSWSAHKVLTPVRIKKP